MGQTMNTKSTYAVRRGGFTIVETVFSIVMLMMVMAGAYKIITSTASLNRVVRNHYVAANLAKNRLERARNFPYPDLPLLAENLVLVNDNGVPAADGRFRRTTAVNTNYGPGVTALTVTVGIKNLRSGNFNTETESISSLYTEFLSPP